MDPDQDMSDEAIAAANPWMGLPDADRLSDPDEALRWHKFKQSFRQRIHVGHNDFDKCIPKSTPLAERLRRGLTLEFEYGMPLE
jgi:hypothetical protein